MFHENSFPSHFWIKTRSRLIKVKWKVPMGEGSSKISNFINFHFKENTNIIFLGNCIFLKIQYFPPRFRHGYPFLHPWTPKTAMVEFTFSKPLCPPDHYYYYCCRYRCYPLSDTPFPTKVIPFCTTFSFIPFSFTFSFIFKFSNFQNLVYAGSLT